MKWINLSQHPKQEGWYLLRATNALPKAVGRSWFNGNHWEHEHTDTVRNYLRNGAILEYLDESTPEAPVFSLKDMIDAYDSGYTERLSIEEDWDAGGDGDARVPSKDQYFKEKFSVDINKK